MPYEGFYNCIALLDFRTMEFTDPHNAISSVSGEMRKAYIAYSEGFIEINTNNIVILKDKNKKTLATWTGKMQEEKFFIDIDGEICQIENGRIDIGLAIFEKNRVEQN